MDDFYSIKVAPADRAGMCRWCKCTDARPCAGGGALAERGPVFVVAVGSPGQEGASRVPDDFAARGRDEHRPKCGAQLRNAGLGDRDESGEEGE